MKNRVAWGLAAVLVVMVLGGAGLLFVRLRPYWVARYRGAGADLRGAVLTRAQLVSVNLQGADLRGADLRGADLSGALLGGSQLQGADLRGANLNRTAFCPIYLDVEAALLLHAGKVRQATLSCCVKSALYDSHTRWPANFDPQGQGPLRVE
jgi:hypothetical protein